MSKDDTRWADHLLETARASAGPHPKDAARNLASIEARLGIGPSGSSGAASSPAGGTLAVDAAGRLGAWSHVRSDVGKGSLIKGSLIKGSLIKGSLIKGSLIKGSLIKGSLVRGGLVLAFGIGTGIIGYFIGRAETLRSQALMAVDADAVLTPAVPGRADGEPAGGENGLAVRALSSVPAGASGVASAASRLPAHVRGEASIPAIAPPHRSVAQARRSNGEVRSVPRSERVATAPSTLVQPSSLAAPAKNDAFELSDALELLRRAEAAVRRSDGLEARMWLSDLDRRAPPQLLVEERLVTLTLANCVLGDVEAARAALHELEGSNPESIYRARLEGSCVAARRPRQ